MPYTNASSRSGFAVEGDVREMIEHARAAHVGRERARLRRSEDAELGALAPGVLERVVEVVVARVGGPRVGDRAQQPQLLVVRDVREVPHEGRHQRRHLPLQLLVVEGLEERQRAIACVAELVGHDGAQVHTASIRLSAGGSAEPSERHASSRSSARQRPRATYCSK